MRAWSHHHRRSEAQDNMKYRNKEFVKVLVLCLAAGFVFTFCIYVLNHSG
jgi:hypothetical protein